MITVCFRCDDPSATSDHDLERRMLALFRRHGVPLCVAPIPFRRTPEGSILPLARSHAEHWIEAQQEGLADIALHGHTHIDRSKGGKGARSEFRGQPLAQQSSLVAEGLAHLRTVFPGPIEGFVPPWNSYDGNTARAVLESGLRYLSAGWQRYGYRDLVLVPRTCNMKDARRAIDWAQSVTAFDPLVVVVMHPDEFEEYRNPPRPDDPPPFTSLAALDSLLGWLRHELPESVSSIREVALARSRPLWTPYDLPLPYRLKATVPNNLLLRRSKAATLPRMVLQMLGLRRQWNSRRADE